MITLPKQLRLTPAHIMAAVAAWVQGGYPRTRSCPLAQALKDTIPPEEKDRYIPVAGYRTGLLAVDNQGDMVVQCAVTDTALGVMKRFDFYMDGTDERGISVGNGPYRYDYLNQPNATRELGEKVVRVVLQVPDDAPIPEEGILVPLCKEASLGT